MKLKDMLCEVQLWLQLLKRMKSRSSAVVEEHLVRNVYKVDLFCQSDIHEEALTVDKSHQAGVQLVHIVTVTEPRPYAYTIIFL